MAATDKTLAPDSDPRFIITKLQNSNGAQITISDVKTTDAGAYWYGIQYPSFDMYKQLRIVIHKPPTRHSLSPSTPTEVDVTSPTPETQNNHMDDLDIVDHKDDTVQQTLKQCNGNSACALALLHKKALDIPGDCWVCHALTARWQARPLTANIVFQEHMKESWTENAHDKCNIPLGMIMLLNAGKQIRNNVPVTPHPNVTCSPIQPLIT